MIIYYCTIRVLYHCKLTDFENKLDFCINLFSNKNSNKNALSSASNKNDDKNALSPASDKYFIAKIVAKKKRENKQ